MRITSLLPREVRASFSPIKVAVNLDIPLP